MTRAITICSTCRYSRAEQCGPDGRTGGAILASLVRQEAKARGDETPIRMQSCLWACVAHCNVLLQDDDRFSYLAGGLQPTQDVASALLDWFGVHGRTPSGDVPYGEWPQALSGHFIARIPPLKRGKDE